MATEIIRYVLIAFTKALDECQNNVFLATHMFCTDRIDEEHFA